MDAVTITSQVAQLRFFKANERISERLGQSPSFLLM